MTLFLSRSFLYILKRDVGRKSTIMRKKNRQLHRQNGMSELASYHNLI